MAKYKNLTGQRFGNLVATEVAGRARNGCYLWRCLCDCGVEVIKQSGVLISGHATSCGCKTVENRRKATMAARSVRQQKINTKHEHTICWDCIRSAAPPNLQCSWDSKKELPEGAKAHGINSVRGQTLIVTECPLFLSIYDKENKELLAAERKKVSAKRGKEVAESVMVVSSYGRERVNIGG